MLSIESLLFLLPPSCMVASIGKSVDKLSFSSLSFNNSITVSNFKNPLLAMSSEENIRMDIQSGRVLTNDSEVWERNPLPSTISFRDPFMVSSRHATLYHDKMDTDLDDALATGRNDNEHLELSYETKQEYASRIGKATNQQDTTRPPATNNEVTPLHVLHKDDIINIQLLYDSQAPTEPELWSGSFHPISLHSFIEYFALDAKNIKVSLNFLAKYIQGKQVNSNKANDLDDFDGMGDAI